MTSPTWGDAVWIKECASLEMCPGELAEVCGMREIETAEQARQFKCAIGTVLYLVEFGDGTSLEVPEAFLKLVNGDDK